MKSIKKYAVAKSYGRSPDRKSVSRIGQIQINYIPSGDEDFAHIEIKKSGHPMGGWMGTKDCMWEFYQGMVKGVELAKTTLTK